MGLAPPPDYLWKGLFQRGFDISFVNTKLAETGQILKSKTEFTCGNRKCTVNAETNAEVEKSIHFGK